ncbi:hypothetical protein B0H13DRAFT_2050729, partial [Mycena leptocephala]
LFHLARVRHRPAAFSPALSATRSLLRTSCPSPPSLFPLHARPAPTRLFFPNPNAIRPPARGSQNPSGSCPNQRGRWIEGSGEGRRAGRDGTRARGTSGLRRRDVDGVWRRRRAQHGPEVACAGACLHEIQCARTAYRNGVSRHQDRRRSACRKHGGGDYSRRSAALYQQAPLYKEGSCIPPV